MASCTTSQGCCSRGSRSRTSRWSRASSSSEAQGHGEAASRADHARFHRSHVEIHAAAFSRTTSPTVCAHGEAADDATQVEQCSLTSSACLRSTHGVLEFLKCARLGEPLPQPSPWHGEELRSRLYHGGRHGRHDDSHVVDGEAHGDGEAHVVDAEAHAHGAEPHGACRRPSLAIARCEERESHVEEGDAPT